MTEEQSKHAEMLAGLRNAFKQAVEDIDAYLNWLGQKQGLTDAEKPQPKPEQQLWELGLPTFETPKTEGIIPLKLGDVVPVGQVVPTLPSPSADPAAIEQTMENTVQNQHGTTGTTRTTSGAISAVSTVPHITDAVENVRKPPVLTQENVEKVSAGSAKGMKRLTLQEFYSSLRLAKPQGFTEVEFLNFAKKNGYTLEEAQMLLKRDQDVDFLKVADGSYVWL
jgi:hypothetical protein